MIEEKSSNTEQHKVLMRNTSQQKSQHAALRIEKFKAKERDIDV